MVNIIEKTIAELLDELITTSLKCWFAQETVCSESDPQKVAEAAKLAQETNARRNALMRAINNKLDPENQILGKTYG